MIVKCSKAKKMLGAYLDGELSDRKSSKVKRHLMECSSCLWELKSFQKVDEFGQLVANPEHQNLFSWEDYMADLRGKLEKAKVNRNYWISCFYTRLRYTIPEFVSYWFWKILPGFAFALVTMGLIYGVSYIRNNLGSSPQKVDTAQVASNLRQGPSVSKAVLPDPAKQREPESQKLAFNFYLKEHKNAIMQQASYTNQSPQKSIELDGNDILYYDTIRGTNQERQGEAGILLRAPRHTIPTKTNTVRSKAIANSLSLSAEQADISVSFKPVLPQTLYPGYLLESIKKLEGMDCLHLIYNNGINTLSIFEQSASDEEKLHSSDFKEYIMYSKEGDDPANIIGWNSDGVSFTIIGNEDFPQLINITREIQGSNTTDSKPNMKGSNSR
jgi:hypothetical protein